jgi:threonine dehydrogenase-like Zn-dependent dehydrogenase
METALNLVADGSPLVGEQVAVFGQGIVGLLTTALLAQFPLASLVTLDRYPRRRRTSMDLGAQASLDPLVPETMDQLRSMLKGNRTYCGADLTFEISGNPAVLDTAIASTGFGGRVVIGSWYGKRRSVVDLGGCFYRNGIHMIGSLGSIVPPGLSSRWTRARRTQLALHMIGRIRPSSLITHKFPLEKASNAFAFLDQNPSEYIEVILSYEG